MITEIETAIADYLRAAFTANETLDGAAWEVKPATSVTAAPKNKVLVIVAAPEVPHSHPALALAMIHIYVSTPAEPPAIAATATLFEQAVVRAFSILDVPTVEADIAELLAVSLPDWSSGGIVVKGWQTGREQNNFNPHFALECGLYRV